MWQELTTLWQSIRDPEYLHLLLEPLPLYGLGLGLAFLAVAFMFGEIKCRMLALGIICLSCISVWPYNELREKATPRILATRSPDFAPLIIQQTQRRQDCAWPYYLMAALSFTALCMTKHPKARIMLLIVMTGSLLLFWFSIWLHKKECEVYHRNIVRFVPVR